MTSELPQVWFAGSTHVGKHTCITSLVKHDVDRGCAAIWNIDTKYYTAKVALQAVTLTQAAPHSSNGCEALVLCFDATKESTFREAVAWFNCNPVDAEIRLIVANKVDELPTGRDKAVQRPSWLQSAISWSVDECFEYIEACAGVPSLDETLTLDGEKQGMRRVADALKAHMWPGMQRTGSKQKTSTLDELFSHGFSSGSGRSNHDDANRNDISNGKEESEVLGESRIEYVGGDVKVEVEGEDQQCLGLGLGLGLGYEPLPGGDESCVTQHDSLPAASEVGEGVLSHEKHGGAATIHADEGLVGNGPNRVNDEVGLSRHSAVEALGDKDSEPSSSLTQCNAQGGQFSATGAEDNTAVEQRGDKDSEAPSSSLTQCNAQGGQLAVTDLEGNTAVEQPGDKDSEPSSSSLTQCNAQGGQLAVTDLEGNTLMAAAGCRVGRRRLLEESEVFVHRASAVSESDLGHAEQAGKNETLPGSANVSSNVSEGGARQREEQEENETLPGSAEVVSDRAAGHGELEEPVVVRERKDDLKADKDQEESDAEAEENLEELEKLMLEMQGARETLSKLSDDERRREASRLALRMAQLLGMGDSDEDDD